MSQGFASFFAFETSKEDYPKWKSHIQKQGISIDHEQDWGNGFFSFYFINLIIYIASYLSATEVTNVLPWWYSGQSAH